MLVPVLVFALWLASTLGFVHRSAHGLPRPVSATAMVQASGSSSVAVAVARSFGWDALFGDHDSGQCRLYDQLSHGSALLAAPVVALSFALPCATFDFLQGQALARWVALFDARGPPFFR